MVNPRVRPLIIGLAAYYVVMTGLELVLGVTHAHRLDAFDGTKLFESTLQHTGVHVLMSIGLVVCAIRWQKLGRPAMWVLGAILTVTSLLSLLHPEFAGEGLGHATMPAGYLIINGAGAAASLVGAWLTSPAPGSTS